MSARPWRGRQRAAMLFSMNARAKHLLDEAMTLTTAERAELASELLASLDGEAEEGVEEAWAKEIAKRAHDALSGVPAASEVHDFLDRAEARLRTQR